jgi:hypothetical protein
MSQSLLNKAIYARTMNGVIVLSDGTLEIQNGNISNANNINTNYLKTQLLDISSNVVIDGNLNLKGNLTAGDISTDAHTINGKMTFSNVVPECSILPTTSQQLTNKSYTDGNFVYKTGAVNELITGLKTFSARVICTNPSIGTSISDLINVSYADTWYGRLNNTNNWSGLNNFNVARVPITVQNTLWTDGSGVAPDNTTKSRVMFNNVKNQTFAIQGWTFSGTAIATINGMGAEWNFGNPGGYNNYNSPLAGSINGVSSGNYWMNFNCYSSGSTASNSTFYLESPPVLQPGMYIIQWYSKFTAGTQYSTTSLTVSLGGTTNLLTYNDSDTRATNIWRLRSITVEVKTASKLRWTYRDTQATPNRYFSASICNLTITNYPAIKVFDASNNTYIAGSLAQINNASLVGINNITGSLNMIGTPYFYTTKGATNVAISSDFGTATGAETNATNIAIGSIAPYATAYSNNIMIGINTANDNSYPAVATASNSVVVASNSGSPNDADIMVGLNIQKKGSGTSSTNNTLVGSYICDNATSSQPLVHCTAVGGYIWNAYYTSVAGNNPPEENVAIGYRVQSQGAFIGGSYNTAVGSYSQTWISGNITNSSYNTSLGYYSGTDPQANGSATFREKYYGGTYIGAWARSRGDVVGVRNATALGYNASADASYCTVIGADASFNLANSIRLGRPQDRTVVSSLWSQGTTDVSGIATFDVSSNFNGVMKSRTVFLNYANNSHITTTTTLTFPVNEFYSVDCATNGADYSITLPEITSASQLGTKITFRQTVFTGGVGGYGGYIVSLNRAGANYVIELADGLTTINGLDATSDLISRTVVALKFGSSSYGWYVI